MLESIMDENPVTGVNPLRIQRPETLCLTVRELIFTIILPEDVTVEPDPNNPNELTLTLLLTGEAHVRYPNIALTELSARLITMERAKALLINTETVLDTTQDIETAKVAAEHARQALEWHNCLKWLARFGTALPYVLVICLVLSIDSSDTTGANYTRATAKDIAQRISTSTVLGVLAFILTATCFAQPLFCYMSCENKRSKRLTDTYHEANRRYLARRGRKSEIQCVRLTLYETLECMLGQHCAESIIKVTDEHMKGRQTVQLEHKHRVNGIDEEMAKEMQRAGQRRKPIKSAAKMEHTGLSQSDDPVGATSTGAGGSGNPVGATSTGAGGSGNPVGTSGPSRSSGGFSETSPLLQAKQTPNNDEPYNESGTYSQ